MNFNKELIGKHRKSVEALLVETWEKDSFSLKSLIKDLPEKTQFYFKTSLMSRNGRNDIGLYYWRRETDEEVVTRLTSEYLKYQTYKKMFEE